MLPLHFIYSYVSQTFYLLSRSPKTLNLHFIYSYVFYILSTLTFLYTFSTLPFRKTFLTFYLLLRSLHFIYSYVPQHSYVPQTHSYIFSTPTFPQNSPFCLFFYFIYSYLLTSDPFLQRSTVHSLYLLLRSSKLLHLIYFSLDFIYSYVPTVYLLLRFLSILSTLTFYLLLLHFICSYVPHSS